ncbi:MAG: exo-alpha-sialidase [Clostridia bacterium]|nr:exo-alpha-sialidase [Clostridia bacterium]
MKLRLLASQTVCTAFGKSFREPRIPGVLALEDGTVLLCHEARAENSGDWGDIDVRVLRMEKGSPVREVLRLGESLTPGDGRMRTWGNPTLIDAGGGRVLLLFNRNYEQGFMCGSADGGRSWGAIRDLTPVLRGFSYSWNVCAFGPGHGARLSSGRLIAPLWLANGEYYDEGRRRQHRPSVSGCIYTDDGGKSWQAGFEYGEKKNPSETSLAPLPDGRVMFSFRNEEDARKRLTGFSSDGGQTLDESPFFSITDPICFGGLCAFRDGALLANCFSETRRENLALSHTRDGCNWEQLYLFKGPAGYADVYALGRRVYVFSEETDTKNWLIGRLVLSVLEAEE